MGRPNVREEGRKGARINQNQLEEILALAVLEYTPPSWKIWAGERRRSLS